MEDRDKKPALRNKEEDGVATAEMTDMAINIGDYERYFIIERSITIHRNPNKLSRGWQCRSVSIIAKGSAVTDPFQQASYIGTKKGIKTHEETRIDGIFLDKNGKIHITQNLRKAC